MAEHGHDHSHDVSTTGHTWDDEDGFPLQEYNNPLPTWWLYTFYATIVYAVIYWFLYPAWPLVNSFTKGMLGANMYQELAAEEAAAKEKRKGIEAKLANLPLEDIAKDNQLWQFAMSSGKAIFGDNCAPCHGAGGVGSQAGGYPILVDDDWLYGGTMATIQETITHGRAGMMPAHDKANGGAFTSSQVAELTEYVLDLSKRSSNKEAAQKGKALFNGEAGCNNCHGDNGKGSLLDTAGGQKIEPSIGAPNLADAIWLYGGDPATIQATIAKGRNGHMPAWGDSGRLSAMDIKMVTVYVHGLGGGKKAGK
ncbi:MAG: cytochrome-c oxidase, cbb3-type subunit III [Magnetococcales bacterium]|nr:cytochrome-c oxidase, cbb3-type subunit III [Magnetococcales bacterium]NGZ26687.1 cytochrome-c oxidase, cbb3-type subunit III [Magnetococcales bacterium]